VKEESGGDAPGVRETLDAPVRQQYGGGTPPLQGLTPAIVPNATPVTALI